MFATERGPLEFELPAELEAREPPEARGLARDQVRLLVSHLEDDRIEHLRFTDLPDVLCRGDLVVANDSATVPAALTAHRRVDGAEIKLHVSTRLPAGLWVVEPRRISACEGEMFDLPGGASVRLLARYPQSRRLWLAQFDADVPELMARFGRPISYPYLRGEWPIEMYQTVYAGPPGSAEMPSAGRAFSPDVLERLAHRGIGFVTLTLHTGVAMLEAIAGRRHLETAYQAALEGRYLWHEFGDLHLILR